MILSPLASTKPTRKSAKRGSPRLRASRGLGFRVWGLRFTPCYAILGLAVLDYILLDKLLHSTELCTGSTGLWNDTMVWYFMKQENLRERTKFQGCHRKWGALLWGPFKGSLFYFGYRMGSPYLGRYPKKFDFVQAKYRHFDQSLGFQ